MFHFTKRFVLSLSLLSLGGFASVGEANAKVRQGDKAAAFVSVTNSKGKLVKLTAFKNKVVVLTFGASWCKPCKKELPAFEVLAKKYKSKKVVFLAVNIDGSPDKGAAFMKEAGLKVVKGLFDTKLATVESYEPPTMPSTFVIKNGVVIHLHKGYRDGDAEKLAKVLDSAIKNK